MMPVGPFTPGSYLRRPLILLATSLLLFTASLIREAVGREGAGGRLPETAVEMASEAALQRYQARLQRYGGDTYALAQIGLIHLQLVQVDGDLFHYRAAGHAFRGVLKLDPAQPYALLGQGMLALARHDFAAALDWGNRARALSPYSADALGILVDAAVESGRYEQAVALAQSMVDLRPDLASYSRVSYLRELHGDTAGAIEAMQMAVEAAHPGTTPWLWAQVQLGNLYLDSGDGQRAEKCFNAALRYRNGNIHAQEGMAHLLASRGQIDEAIAILRPLVEERAWPDLSLLLADLFWVRGQRELARRQYDLARRGMVLEAEAGVDVALELARFEADLGYGDAFDVVAHARAAYERRPGIYGADALAWALYRAGQWQEARQYSEEALRLGTNDAMLHYHAGMIALALGDEASARTSLQRALAINPAFSIRRAPEVRRLLAELS